MSCRLYRDDAPSPKQEYELLFLIDGMKIKAVAQRWRDEHVGHSTIPAFLDPLRPRFWLAVRVTNLETGSTCDATPATITVPGDRDWGIRGAIVLPHADRRPSCRLYHHPSDGPKPLTEYFLEFQLDGLPFGYVTRRWRDRDIWRSTIPCIADPSEPGTSIAVQAVSFRTGATCVPLPASAISGEFLVGGLLPDQPSSRPRGSRG